MAGMDTLLLPFAYYYYQFPITVIMTAVKNPEHCLGMHVILSQMSASTLTIMIAGDHEANSALHGKRESSSLKAFTVDTHEVQPHAEESHSVRLTVNVWLF